MRGVSFGCALAVLAASGTFPVQAGDANPMLGSASVKPMTSAENKAVVGKGYYSDYYGSLANQYAYNAYYYGYYGKAYDSRSYYSTASNQSYYAYYYFYYASAYANNS